MLVYVATYPRCGSAILRDTIRLNWGHETTNLYTSAKWPDEITILPSTSTQFTPYRYEQHPPRVMLVSPCRELLTRGMRQHLAASAEHFFVKTHENPPQDPIAGEIAIQLVRHPAAAITSQWQLHAATHSETPPLPHFSEGSDTGGRWDRYHLAWGASGMPLFRRRFEDLLRSPLDLVSGLADFLKLPQPENPQVVSAEVAKARNPVRNPIRGADGWMDQISVGELVRIWNRHKMVAKEMGYGMMGVTGPFVPPPQLIFEKKRPGTAIGSETMEPAQREERAPARETAIAASC